MQFSYSATRITDTDQKIIHGRIEADSTSSAKQLLEQQGLAPYTISAYKVQRSIWNKLTFLRKTGSTEVLLFTQNLAVLLKSGTSLTEALSISAEQAKGQFRVVIEAVAQGIAKGKTCSEALAQYPRYFSRLYTDIVYIGEQSGTLEQNLRYLSTQLRKDREVRQKIWSAVLYPILIFVGMSILAAVLAILVLPRLSNIFFSLDVDLPLSTQIVVTASQLLQQYWYVLLLVMVAFIFTAVFLYTLKPVKYVVHVFLLRLPLIGPTLKTIYSARITRTMGVMLQSGLSITKTLDASMESVQNLEYQRVLDLVRRSVIQGETLSQALAKHPSVFPTTVSRMVHVGENSGELDSMLEYVSEYYEENIDRVTKNLTVLIEPLLLLIIGAVIGFIGLAIISPIYELTSVVK